MPEPAPSLSGKFQGAFAGRPCPSFSSANFPSSSTFQRPASPGGRAAPGALGSGSRFRAGLRFPHNLALGGPAGGRFTFPVSTCRLGAGSPPAPAPSPVTAQLPVPAGSRGALAHPHPGPGGSRPPPAPSPASPRGPAPRSPSEPLPHLTGPRRSASLATEPLRELLRVRPALRPITAPGRGGVGAPPRGLLGSVVPGAAATAGGARPENYYVSQRPRGGLVTPSEGAKLRVRVGSRESQSPTGAGSCESRLAPLTSPPPAPPRPAESGLGLPGTTPPLGDVSGRADATGRSACLLQSARSAAAVPGPPHAGTGRNNGAAVEGRAERPGARSWAPVTRGRRTRTGEADGIPLVVSSLGEVEMLNKADPLFTKPRRRQRWPLALGSRVLGFPPKFGEVHLK
ncbi:basic proline-rich protein-like [Perognathus longimembris pacificus]|uniref:basic proline-rich protein-like n=1 Tax=Perognathus longimembris pacificus TaxID=214514 RepID=UPI0020189211|nr:basic proline-rich protein-like [Perognathus longimembris pacificus]